MRQEIPNLSTLDKSANNKNEELEILREHLLRLEMHLAELQESMDKIQLQKEVNKASKLDRIGLATLILKVVEFILSRMN